LAVVLEEEARAALVKHLTASGKHNCPLDEALIVADTAEVLEELLEPRCLCG
jgi:hypothetical protein